MHARLPLLTLLVAYGCTPDVIERSAPQNCLPYENPHDGVDQDCNPLNEFDYDGDGFVVDRIWNPMEGWVDGLAAAQRYALSRGMSPSLVVGGDCDDFDAAVYPGAPGEVPYDAIDTNCDGSNDFDVDGDGWIPTGYWSEVAYYVAGPLDGFATFEVLEGDCDDLDPLVNPEMGDVPYDGRDTNCDGANDFDLDGDKYIHEGLADAWRAHVAVHGQQHIVHGFGDCDDDNNFVNPGAPERVYTPRDVDCDGDPTRARLNVLDMEITNAGPAVFHQGNDFEALVFSADSAWLYDQPGLYGLIIPLMPEPADASGLMRLADSRSELLAIRTRWNGMRVTTVESDRWAHIPLGTGVLGSPLVNPYHFVDGSFAGTQLVADPEGDFVCGDGPTVWLEDASEGPAVETCALVEGDPVLCDPDCVALTVRGDAPMPWSSPDRIVGHHAVVDGRVYAPDGSEPFGITGADDAAVSSGYAAWIDDGQVFVEGPFGVTGPLIATPIESPQTTERLQVVDFYADEVHIGSYWGYVTVFAIDHDGSTTRIAMARLDP